MSALDVAAFGRGVAIGAAIAAPVGPMSLLCMRRTLARGWRLGFATGAGIAAGDGIFALVAALGLAGVMHFMLAHERPLHAAAGAVLIYLGWRTFCDPRAEARPDAARGGSARAALAGALLLTLTNPPTILAFVAVFTAFVPAGFDRNAALMIAGGAFTGSLVWWLALTLLVAALRSTIGPRTRRTLGRVSGALLGLLGAAELRRAA